MARRYSGFSLRHFVPSGIQPRLGTRSDARMALSAAIHARRRSASLGLLLERRFIDDLHVGTFGAFRTVSPLTRGREPAARPLGRAAGGLRASARTGIRPVLPRRHA